MTAMERVRGGRRNLSQAVTDELLRLIGSGEFLPGERLPTERGLMDLFGVGRNTVREAVHALAVQGIVDVRPGRGVTVMYVSSEAALDGSVVSALLDEKAVYDLYEFRRIVEVEAAVRAAQRASGPDIEAIELSLGRFLHAYRERLPTWEQDVSFHKAVAGASHNVIYASVLDVLNERLLAVRRETQRSSAVLARAAQEHTAVFEAIRDRDADRAGKAMTSHIDSAMWALAEARRRLAPARVSTTVPRRGGSKRPAR